ncbi:MAG: rhomboid family intramembrane serine protease [Actinomycetota bacterium]|nr:rhomboid family intramembrane serine protease [Actinomycetota bacterium]
MQRVPQQRAAIRPLSRIRTAQGADGVRLLVGIVALMWAIEVINTLDSNRLDGDGIWPRSLGHLWGILTSPFIHVSFAHLLGNTVPLLFMGLIIALRGAARLALVTAIVIVVGGLGTWLVAPGHSVVGASGVVFGYATYLLTRGLFDRSVLEILTGAVVGAVWGSALLSSLVPHPGVSWQGHAAGALAGVLAAWWLSTRGRRDEPLQSRGVNRSAVRALPD